jgi:hypothetical protein
VSSLVQDRLLTNAEIEIFKEMLQGVSKQVTRLLVPQSERGHTA